MKVDRNKLKKMDRDEICQEFNTLLKNSKMHDYTIEVSELQIALKKTGTCLSAWLDFGSYDVEKTINWFEEVTNDLDER